MERFPRSSWMGSGWYVCGILAALFLCTWNVVAAQPEEKRPLEEILKLTGAEFSEAASHTVAYSGETSYSCAELIQILKAMQSEMKAASDSEYDATSRFREIFGAACRLASPEEVDQLVSIFVTTPPEYFVTQQMLLSVATPWIQRELKALAAEKFQAPVFPAVSKELPEHLKGAPAHVLSLWRYALSIRAPYETSMRLGEEEKGVPYQTNQKTFNELINQVLIGKTSGAAAQLNRFVWGGWCGTGSEMLRDPQNLGIFMSLLRERRLSEAVGASLYTGESNLSPTNPLEEGPNFRKQLWEMCGLDWERLAVGMLLDREGGWFAGSDQLLNSLGAEGTGRGARLFSAAIPFLDEARKWSLSEIFELFLTQPDEKREKSIRIPPRRERTQALPPQVYRELVAALVRTIQSARDYENAQQLARALPSIVEPEYADLIRPLLKHPAEEVAETAAETLRAMGVDVPALVKQAPVLFQLFLNGQPLASREVSFRLHCAGEQGDVSTTVSTDTKGIAALKPIYFINPARSVKRVSFSLRPEHRFSDVEQGRGPNNDHLVPVFSVSVPAPASLQTLTPVIITTYSLSLQFQYNQPPNFYEGSKITVDLQRETDAHDDSGYFSPITITTEKVPQLTFASLQPGDYNLTIHAPGASKWESKVSLKGPKTVPVVLGAGADVRVVLKFEGTDNTAWGDIFRDGKEVDARPSYEGTDKGEIYRGLPPGKYMLRVKSTKELERARAERDSKVVQLDEEPDYAGIEVDFEITRSSPALIDLGEITIPRER